MKILLVYPAIPETFWSHSHALSIIGKRALMPPLGLLTVAALLPPQWESRLVDLNVEPLTDQHLAWADCIFVSGMAIQRQAAREVIARCKSAGKTIIAGGPLFAAEYALFEHVDSFVLSEGESLMGEVARDLERNALRRTYRSREFADLTRSPAPRWDLVDLRHYHCAGVQFSRGCPYDCEFCNVTALLGRRPRTKTAPQIIGELDALLDRGWHGPVFFVDDNLIGHRPALRDQLLPALAEWQKRRGPVPFITQASVDLADDLQLTRQLVEAGFDAVFVGIETPDPDSLAECNKRQNGNRDLAADVRLLQRSGLEVQAGFIVGFDHDTPSIFQRQVDFIRQSGITTAMVGMLHAPPGTKLANRLSAEGRLNGASSGDNTDGTTNIVPVMGLDRLREGYRWVLQRLYAPRAYYQRARSFLREYRRRNLRGPLRLTDVLTFARSAWRLGVLGRERFQYWRLMAWTILHRPRLLPEAVRLAICGHHYRRICQIYGVFTAASTP